MKLRLKIALALAISFVVSGAIVLGITALTYQNAIYDTPTQQTDELLRRLGVTRETALDYIREHPEAVLGYDRDAPGANGAPSVNEAFQQTQRAAQDAAVARSRTWSAVALAITALVAAVVGWILAGRAVIPLRRITARAREASATDLSARVDLGGPHDEVRELGDTFDGMLERLERAFDAQRRFAGQVSHEIRTPLAIISSETELLLRDANPDDQHSLLQIQDATGRVENMIAALLVLSRNESGDIVRQTLDLDRVTGDVLGELVNGAAWHDVRVELALETTPVLADPALLECVVSNLLSNAVRHNRPGGWIVVKTRREGDSSVLEVENSVGSAGSTRRNGIGLTVVDSVLATHGGQLTWDDGTPGIVNVQVRFPVPTVGNDVQYHGRRDLTSPLSLGS